MTRSTPAARYAEQSRARFCGKFLLRRASSTPRRWFVTRGPAVASASHRRDAGLGLIEVVVALAVLALVVLPVTRLVVSTTSSTSQLHLRTEAIDLASQDLEMTEGNLNQGISPSLGVTSTTKTAGTDAFTIQTDFEELTSGASGSSLCTASGGSASGKIGRITATVGWDTGGGGNLRSSHEVVETTLYAPAQENLNASYNGELAVPVDLYPSGAVDTSVPINITVTPAYCSIASCTPIPAGDNTGGTANTGTTGCAVFTDLDPSYAYTAIAEGNPGYVDDAQNSDTTTAPALPGTTPTPVQPSAGQITVTNPILLGLGATVTVDFTPTKYSGQPAITATPPADLPVTVYSAPSVGLTTTTMLGGTSAFSTNSATAQTTLLYPSSTVSIWAGATDSGGSAAGGAVSLSLSPGATTTVNLPIYLLSLEPSTNASLQLTDKAETIVLGTPTGTPLALTGVVPAGSYLLSTTTGTAVSDITVTSTGVCSTSTTETITACAGSTPSTGPISVTG